MTGKRVSNKQARGSRGDDGDVALYWKQPRPQVHRFSRLVAANDIVKGAVDLTGGVSFKLQDLPDYVEFQNLFDQYRIDWVDVMFICKQSGSSPSYPIIYYVEDHDDDGAPTVNQILSSQNTQILQFGSNRTMLKLRIIPNVTRNVYISGITNGYERAPPRTWLDCANANVPHYGYKWYIANYNTVSNPNTTIQLAYRYHFSCKETI